MYIEWNKEWDIGEIVAQVLHTERLQFNKINTLKKYSILICKTKKKHYRIATYCNLESGLNQSC